MNTFRPLFAALVLGAATGAAQAKCNVTLELKNGNGREITVMGNDSKAKVNGGTWSRMNFGTLTIPAGATRDASWVTNMSCSGNAKRDLKIEYQESGSNQTYTEHKDDIDVEPGVAVQVTLKH